jgi:hypothetical protein
MYMCSSVMLCISSAAFFWNPALMQEDNTLCQEQYNEAPMSCVRVMIANDGVRINCINYFGQVTIHSVRHNRCLVSTAITSSLLQADHRHGQGAQDPRHPGQAPRHFHGQHSAGPHQSSTCSTAQAYLMSLFSTTIWAAWAPLGCSQCCL